MAYQDALSLYNSGKIEEAFQELKKCDSSPMVEGLRKECVKLIEEQYRFLIQEALRENPQSTNAGFLYNKYVQKYGPNERLKALVPISGPILQNKIPEEQEKPSGNKKGGIIVGIIAAVLTVLGIFVYKQKTSDNVIEAEWNDNIEVAELDSIVVEDIGESQTSNSQSFGNLRDVSIVYEFDLPDGRHRIIFNGREQDEYGSIFLYAATSDGNGAPQIRKIALKYDRYDDGSDMFSEGLLEYARCKVLPENKMYVLTCIHANSSGWTSEFQLFLLDCKTLSAEHLLDCAAARGTEDGGVTVAIARLTNEDTAAYTAEEIWLMHDLHFDNRGNPESVGNEEYPYSEMQQLFGDNLYKGFLY